MCTRWCSWQHINAHRRDPRVVTKEKEAGRMHLAWMCKLYRRQVAAGRLFLHERPGSATSWQERCVLDVLAEPGVERITADQCQLG